MLIMGNIQRDLAIGAAAEDRVVKMLCDAGMPASKQQQKGIFPDYDIKAGFTDGSGSNVFFTLEVKNDIYAIRSGNIAIETYNPKSGKPSGLGITKANFWVHITDEIHIACVSELKNWVDKTTPFKIITAGGDDNATLFLYKKDIIFDEGIGAFTRIDELSPGELKDVIEDYLN